jgi:hypothetical protein
MNRRERLATRKELREALRGGESRQRRYTLANKPAPQAATVVKTPRKRRPVTLARLFASL